MIGGAIERESEVKVKGMVKVKREGKVRRDGRESDEHAGGRDSEGKVKGSENE